MKEIEKEKSESDGRIRKLLNNERKFLWAPFANVSVATKIMGNLTSSELKKGIEKACEKHPLMRCKVIIEENHDIWFSNESVPLPEVRVVHRTSENQWFNEIIKEFKKPFDFIRGPLIRFVLIYSPEVSDIIIFCQHSICDGTALAYLIQDILEFSANPSKNFAILKPTSISLLVEKKTKYFKDRIKSIFFNRINNKWRKDPYYFDYEDYLNIHQAMNLKYQYNIVLWELSKTETKRLEQLCRNNGVTINSATTVAFYAAYREICGLISKEKNKIVIPYDLRRRLNPQTENVLCLFIGSVEINFKYNQKKNFWENVREFHQIIKKKISSQDLFSTAVEIENLDPTIADSLSFAMNAHLVPKDFSKYDKMTQLTQNEKNIAMWFARKIKTALPIMTISNLGRLDIPERIGPFGIEKMYFAPSTGRSIPLVVGAVGVAGKMTLTVNFIEELTATGSEKKNTYERIKERAKEFLKDFS